MKISFRFFRSLPGHFIQIMIDILRRYSLSLLLLSLLFTYLGKIYWHIDHLSAMAPADRAASISFLAFIADDLLVFGSAGLLVWIVEFFFRRNWVRVITAIAAIPIAVVSLSNLFWLRGTGSQLSIAVIGVGLSRTSEVIPVLEGGLGISGILLLLGSVLTVVGLPLLFQKKWAADGHAPDRMPKSGVAVPLVLLLLGGTGAIARADGKGSVWFGWRLIADNVFVAMGREWMLTSRPNPSPPSAENPAPDPMGRAAPDQLPNILLYIMEATAHRASSMNPEMPRQTPTLMGLGRAGLIASSMRAVMPHTSKAIFSIFCSEYPSMQDEILETADNFGQYCLPRVLTEKGYTTAFFQSADGQFEDRPRLVRNAGYQHFEAGQDLKPSPQPLGYLAGDDKGVVEPLLRWIKSQTKPFFATVLTSATHHTYEIPKRMRARPGLADADQWSPLDRYVLLVNEADKILSEIMAGLEKQNQTENLIVIVTGDHGEAFGEHGGYQHDNIFAEEGLHVPFVIWAQGRISPGTVVTKERSLIDIMPTVLDLAGIPFLENRLQGRSLLRPESRPVRRYFACWYSNVCMGFVENSRKLVYLPNARSWMVFDLASDPLERHPIIDPEEWQEQAESTYRWYNEHRYDPAGLKWSKDTLFHGTWTCADGEQQCVSGLTSEIKQ